MLEQSLALRHPTSPQVPSSCSWENPSRSQSACLPSPGEGWATASSDNLGTTEIHPRGAEGSIRHHKKPQQGTRCHHLCASPGLLLGKMWLDMPRDRKNSHTGNGILSPVFCLWNAPILPPKSSPNWSEGEGHL